MCHGANRAFEELSRHGTITAGSVMVPCPWFSEMADLAAGDSSLDLGVHLTITSEMRYYRWAPITRATKASGLIDNDGYMWPDVASVRRHAEPDAVEAEWRAQVERALDAGIDVTHLDAHMGAALAPEWCDRYVQLGIAYNLPVLLTPTMGAYGPIRHLAGADDGPYNEAVQQARAAGMPVFDEVIETDFDRPRSRDADYPALLGHLGDDDGLVYCAFHPCAPGGAEIEQIEPHQHHVRTDEYALFGTDEWRQWLADQPIELIGMRELRDAPGD